jgi:hypothetical protein
VRIPLTLVRFRTPARRTGGRNLTESSAQDKKGESKLTARNKKQAAVGCRLKTTSGSDRGCGHLKNTEVPSMRQIPLSQGQVDLVDDCDFEVLNDFRWSYRPERGGGQGYAVRHK